MKRIFLLVISLCLCFICSGCFNYTEINDLAVVSALGIEKDAKTNEFVTSAQIVNIKKTGSEGGNEDISKVVLYSGKGKDIFSSIRDISRQSSKKVFLSHLKILVLDKEIINNDLDKVIDFFARNTDSKINFFVTTSSNNKPKEILETLTPMDSLPSQDIYNTLKSSEELIGNTTTITYEEFLNLLLQKGVNPVYPNLELKGSTNDSDSTNSLKKANPDSIIEIKNLVTFDNNGKMLTLNKEESLGYNFIINKVKNPIITSKCKAENDRYFSIEIIDSSSKMKVTKNNSIDINIELTGSVGEMNCDVDLSKTETRRTLNKITTNKVKKTVNSTIDLAKKNNNDFIGLGNYLYKNEKKYFDFDNKDWDTEGLNKVKVNVNVKLDIIKEGNLEKNILEREIYD